MIFLLFVEKRNLYSVHWMDLFGTWDFPLLTVNICCKFAKLNSLLAADFELQSCRRWTLRTPRSMCTDAAATPLPGATGRGQPACTVLHVDYHCLYSSVGFGLFGFFCFQLGWGRPLCVYWGEGVENNYPKLFNVLLFLLIASTLPF